VSRYTRLLAPCRTRRRVWNSVEGYDHGRGRKHGGVLINTGGASALGKMLVKVAAAERLTLVSVVRSEEQRQVLLSLGAEHVLLSPTRIVLDPTTTTEHAEQVRADPNLQLESQVALPCERG
jgi:NADPH:quinone reductase-like Zn-dependent oxidoreductase